jgi:hypothetical protein
MMQSSFEAVMVCAKFRVGGWIIRHKLRGRRCVKLQIAWQFQAVSA